MEDLMATLLSTMHMCLDFMDKIQLNIHGHHYRFKQRIPVQLMPWLLLVLAFYYLVDLFQQRMGFLAHYHLIKTTPGL